MSLLPVDKDVLEDVCQHLARENHGFVYVNDHKNAIKSGYENGDTGTLNARSLSGSDMRKALQELTTDEFTDLEEIRDGVYYIDPFGMQGNRKITAELTELFGQRLVVTGETLRSRFSLAVDDIDFFADELAERRFLRRITAGKRDYYTIGPALKEHADNVGLDSRLTREATNGKIAHSDLESVVDVAATSDVIRYLDREGYIVDLNGEYLVEDAIDEYADFLAREIEDAVESVFAGASSLLPHGEYEQVIENEIESRFDVFSEARSVRREILDEAEAAVEERLGLEHDREIVVAPAFADLVDAEARQTLADVKSEYDVFASPSQFVERAEEHFEELHAGSKERVTTYFRDAVEDRYEEIVRKEEF